MDFIKGINANDVEYLLKDTESREELEDLVTLKKMLLKANNPNDTTITDITYSQRSGEVTGTEGVPEFALTFTGNIKGLILIKFVGRIIFNSTPPTTGRIMAIYKGTSTQGATMFKQDNYVFNDKYAIIDATGLTKQDEIINNVYLYYAPKGNPASTGWKFSYTMTMYYKTN